jgi:TP901-1 family phage major tail protein
MLRVDGAPLAGVRSKNPSFNKEPIDITDDNSAGWRELLATPGQRDVTIPVSGVTKSPFLRQAFFNSDILRDVELEYPDGGILSGTFFLASYSETGEYNGAITFSTELQSSGAVAYDQNT